jgi:C-terminal processing protease CtpA/Prc
MGIPANASRVIVVAVVDPALSSGVMVGDLVMGINGRKVQSVDEFLRAARWVMNSRGRDGRLPDVVITLNRMGNPLLVTVSSELVEVSARGL